MSNIIVNFRPFVFEQEILVYENGICVQTTKASMDRLSDVISGFKKQYNTKQVTLVGNSDYLSKFKAELNLKFNNENVEINIVKR